MLFADKRALETQLKVNMITIREKELNYYTQNCQAVCTQAALLAGFAYSGLTQVAIPHDQHYVLKLLYLIVTTTAMCLELIAVMNTTLLSMMGPGLALRGPDGSMHPAVEGMVYEYNTAYICFVLGLITFHFSAALFAWLMFTPKEARFPLVAFFVSACIALSLYMLMRYATRVFNRFRCDEVVTGRFQAEELHGRTSADGTGGLINKEQCEYSSEQTALAEAQDQQ
mmetsp:Transcript_7228/g.12164  ORF Transcript_7228/g.12164 Transcript_7228/m.12164 type:complete len:227 (+) Transcript_7228:77-757(+)